MAKKTYLDIGHKGDSSVLWVFLPKKGGIITHPASGGNSHDSVWGLECIDWFRGRYDPDTKELSIVYPPYWKKMYGIPMGMKEALENEFGEVRTFEFNPLRRGR